MNKIVCRSEKSFLDATSVVLKDDFSDVSKTFLYSNEKLGLLFSSISYFLSENEIVFSDKSISDKPLCGADVLCVAGSGDQAFWSLNLGANVDIFDTKIVDLIKDLLARVTVNSDEELAAYNYWSLFVNKNSRFIVSDLFIEGDCISGNNIADKDLSYLKSRLPFYNGSFYNFNLTDSNIDIPKKYDLIILSNILEHVKFDKLNDCMENISKLLKEDGVAICSYLMFNCYELKRREQARLLSELFDSTELTPNKYNSCDIGFTLQKKKK